MGRRGLGRKESCSVRMLRTRVGDGVEVFWVCWVAVGVLVVSRLSVEVWRERCAGDGSVARICATPPQGCSMA